MKAKPFFSYVRFGAKINPVIAVLSLGIIIFSLQDASSQQRPPIVYRGGTIVRYAPMAVPQPLPRAVTVPQGPALGYRWNPYAPPSYYQQQNQPYVQAYRQVQQIRQNPYVNSGNLAWNGVQCAGGALVVVGTDGVGLPVLARTGYACTQAGLAAWRYGQALGR
jgi:hypothetical protein